MIVPSAAVQTPQPTVGGERPTWWAAAALASLTLALLLTIASVGAQEFAPDEFEHVHAAYCLAHGERLYTDFFEHHAPLLYYLLEFPVRVFGPHPPALFGCRALMAGLKVLTWAFLFAVWRRSHGNAIAAAAVALLAFEWWHLSAGQGVYADVPAAFLLVLAAWAGTRAAARARMSIFVLAGFGVAAAVLSNLKAVFPALGVGVALVLIAIRQPHRRAASLAGLFAGAVVALGLTLLLLGPATWSDAWRLVIDLNSRWLARHSVWPHVVESARAHPGFWLLVLVGFVAWLREAWRSPVRAATDAFALGALGAIVGALVLPVVWEEYLIGVVPLLAVWAARGLAVLARSAAWHTRPGRSPAAVALVVAVGLGAWLAHTASSRLALVVGALVCVGALFWAFRAWRRSQPHTFVTALTLALIALPAATYARDLARWPNRAQLHKLDEVLAWTAPDEAVLDGYSGFGLFRPHTYYYWMLHEELQQVLSPAELGPDLVRALETRRPKLVIWDHWFNDLPPEVHEYVRAHYRPSTDSDFWLRRDAADPSE